MGRYLAIFLLLVGTAEAANVHPTPVPTATPANTPVPTATAVPTATPLAFGTPGVVAIFGSPELQPYAGATCPTPGMVSSISASGGLTCITPTPAPTATPVSGTSAVYAFATNSGDETLSTGVATAITLDTDITNVGGLHSTVTNNTRMTAPQSGWYTATCDLRFDSNSTGARAVQIKVNGSTLITNQSFTAVVGITEVVSTAQYFLNTNDYFECYGFQSSGGNLAVKKLANSSPSLAVSLIH